MTAEESALELENRRRIYQIIEKYPGIHFRELFRKLNISMGSFEYHLNVLEHNDLIYLQRSGGFTRYFVKGKLGSEDKELASMLRNNKLRTMLLTLILEPGLSHSTLTNKLGWPKSTTSFYLKKLINAGLIEERVMSENLEVSKTGKPPKGLFITRPDKIVNILMIYKSGFLDELSNRILDLVERL